MSEELAVNRLIEELDNGVEIYFQPLKEWTNKRDHYINECGWSDEEYKEIQGGKWFCAKVTATKLGFVLATRYLGCCHYPSYKSFIGCQYYQDMRDEVVEEAENTINSLKLEVK